MAEFSVQKTISMPLADVKTKLNHLMDEAGDLKKYDSSLQIDWKENGAHVSGKVFTGDVSLTDQGGSTLVNITVKVSFLLTPLKGKIKATIEKEIDRMFASPT